MLDRRSAGRLSARIGALVAAMLLAGLAAGGARGEDARRPADLVDFGTRYAAAWSGGDPEALAAFYEEDGALVVNDGDPAVGRAVIAATARSYMESFPDMVVAMETVEATAEGAIFRWRWTGTYAGPGGNGAPVDLRGHEAWTFGASGRIALSDGRFDADEYERQVSAGPAGQ